MGFSGSAFVVMGGGCFWACWNGGCGAVFEVRVRLDIGEVGWEMERTCSGLGK